MRLYIDLNKAGQTSGGSSTISEEQAVAGNNESYVRRTSGVGGESVGGYDDPDVGRDWSHGEDEALDDEVEAKRQARNKQAQDRNQVPTDKEAGITKAFDSSANDLLKSLTCNVRRTLNLHELTPVETEFLKSVKGFTDDEIKKSHPTIMGRDRTLFSNWLCERAARSVDNFYRKK